jgi:SEC-C motif-containing protein
MAEQPPSSASNPGAALPRARPAGDAPCPCGGGAFSACCAPALDGARAPATAEALMRSRYTAYALGEADYIVATEKPAPARASIAATMRTTRFLRLEVLESRGGPGDVEGLVHFRAYSDRGALDERSRFARDTAGRWVYRARAPEAAAALSPGRAKVGRNEPCPCGSGKKAKRCCAA